MSDNHQKIMDVAYDKWQKNGQWNKEEFLMNLEANEKFAVIMGNFNYQVQNGGFIQWLDNGYATTEAINYILYATKNWIKTETANKVYDLVIKFRNILHNVGLSPEEYHRHPISDEFEWESFYNTIEDENLNMDYYDIDDQFMKDCEEYINIRWPEKE